MMKKLLIPIIDMNAAWCFRGFSSERYAKEYCCTVLKVPIEYIETSKLLSTGIEIELKDIDERHTEEWYLHLLSFAQNTEGIV